MSLFKRWLNYVKALPRNCDIFFSINLLHTITKDNNFINTPARNEKTKTEQTRKDCSISCVCIVKLKIIIKRETASSNRCFYKLPMFLSLEIHINADCYRNEWTYCKFLIGHLLLCELSKVTSSGWYSSSIYNYKQQAQL